MSTGIRKVILDTNVLIVANGESEQASLTCVSACQTVLKQVQEQQSLIVLDEPDFIFKEYQNHLNPTGQPGLGDVFFKWLFKNRWYSEYCEIVPLQPLRCENDRHNGNFAEFPDSPALQTFDPSDRKFVATCIAASKQPVIFNAVDDGWVWHQAALDAEGIRVDNLCSCP
jgi:hypothetical protein